VSSTAARAARRASIQGQTKNDTQPGAADREFHERPYSKNSRIYLSHSERTKKYQSARRVPTKIRERGGSYEVVLGNNPSGWGRLFADSYDRALWLAQRANRGQKLFSA